MAEEALGQPVRCPTCGTTFSPEPWAGNPAELPPSTEAPPTASYVAGGNAEAPADPPPAQPAPGPIPGAAPLRPAKVEALGYMMLGGGILALLMGAGLATFTRHVHVFCCHFWPGSLYAIILGIMAIIKASQILGHEGYRQAPPSAVAVMQIINILNGDVANCVLGILGLVFLKDPEVRRYFRG
jgi:hypothetical protein